MPLVISLLIIMGSVEVNTKSTSLSGYEFVGNVDINAKNAIQCGYEFMDNVDINAEIYVRLDYVDLSLWVTWV